MSAEVWGVSEFYWNYSQSSFKVRAVFATEESAKDYAEKMGALDKEYDYEVERFEIWDRADELVTTYNAHGFVNSVGGYSSYKSKEWLPSGALITPLVEVIDDGVWVKARTQEEAASERKRVIGELSRRKQPEER